MRPKIMDYQDFKAATVLFLEVNPKWHKASELYAFSKHMGLRINQSTAYGWLMRMAKNGEINQSTIGGDYLYAKPGSEHTP